jgi:4a-hydroxytetrahydrobiopterin dehydratase
MRVGRSRRAGHAKDLDSPYATDYLTDALTQLQGWTREGREFRRTLHLDETQHAALAERMKVIADALRLCPDVRRQDGNTQIRLCIPEGAHPSPGEVTLAARVENLYRSITESPGLPH